MFPGQIIDTCNEPRSFIVKDNNGTLYRRSQDHIKKTPESKLNNQELQNSSQNIVELPPIVNNDPKEYVTRKGRVVKQPKKLNL